MRITPLFHIRMPRGKFIGGLWITFKMTVKEARELAMQEFQMAVKEGDRAVLKFREWLVVEDDLLLLPKYVYLLAVEPPFVGE
jgi:hypothetical protein